MRRRVLALMRKEFIQLFRDKMILIILGYAFFIDPIAVGVALTFELKHIPMAIYDQDRTARSRELIAHFDEARNFELLYMLESQEELDRRLTRGEALLALVIPPDFAHQVQRGRGKVQLLVDGSNSNAALLALNYASGIITEYSRRISVETIPSLPPGMTSAPTIQNDVRIWYNPNALSDWFMPLSELFGIIMMVAVLLPAAAIVREKEAGTIEQLLVAPIRPRELIAAKLLPMFVVIMLGLVVSLFWVRGFFGIPMVGRLELFVALSALFLLSCFGLGLFISLVSRNLQQALIGTFFVLFPLMFLSGMMVPIHSMPIWLQYLSYLSPLRYYLEIAFWITLKGVGLSVLWPQVVVLSVMGVVLLVVSAKRLRTAMG